MYKSFLTLLTTLLCSLLLFGCSKTADERKEQTPAVTVIKVGVQDIRDFDSFVGKVDAASKAAITARVNGYLSDRLVKEGDLVQKDQPLFIIEQDNYVANVAQAKAALKQAQANADNLKLQKDRAEKLLQSQGIPQAKYDDISASYLVASASVLQAKAALEMAELNLSYTTVTSPVAGKVGFINFNIGETVGPSSGPLTTVISKEPMYVIFSVSDKLFQEIKNRYGINGNSAEELAANTDLKIILSDGSVYNINGKVDFIDNAVTGITDSVKVRGVFSNPNDVLMQGQTVNVELTSKTDHKQVVIPQSAIMTDLSGNFVYVVSYLNADDKPADSEFVDAKANYLDPAKNMANVERRYITSGNMLEGGNQIISANLSEGEFIVVEGLQRVLPGKPVKAFTGPEYGLYMKQMMEYMKAQQAQGAKGGGK